MNKEVVANGIKELRENLPERWKIPVLALKSKGGNWWESIDYSLRINITNYLRSQNMGENAIGIGSLELITNSGKPFYVVMLEQAFK